jgi:hypothetical protein
MLYSLKHEQGVASKMGVKLNGLWISVVFEFPPPAVSPRMAHTCIVVATFRRNAQMHDGSDCFPGVALMTEYSLSSTVIEIVMALMYL